MTMTWLSRLAATSSRRVNYAAAASHGRRTFATSENLVKTALNQMHKDLGGSMVPFAGYELPVLFEGHDHGGVLKEHHWCRAKAGLFDVSHMGQVRWRGKDRVAFLETLVVSPIADLKVHHGCLSLITNETGGIIDDTVITNAGDYLYMVINGATKHSDMEHFQRQLDEFEGDVSMEYLGDDMQLLAIQGPAAASAVKTLLPSNFELEKMAFMTGVDTTLDGVNGCRITRCGYTGEDGFELAMPASAAEAIAGRLLQDPNVNPTGLGARDSLRLEAGLCLYGNDLNETINPVEAGLAWTMGPPKSRRRMQQGFLGAEHILTPDGKLQAVSRKRIGIFGMKAPARDHTEIYDATGETKIGEVTSGTFGPTVKAPVAMGYVDAASSKVGTEIMLKIRNKMVKAQVTKMPFITPNYYKVPSSE
ncbi:hypothetical protein MPSEU_000447300 [Mayamaea pseudoterrestris]|nr:hypothetical protein MPSEU_000447300 [Mayamaea pseudoterrestris]